jgi:DNA (cytosine-5)-methyltransferase 1
MRLAKHTPETMVRFEKILDTCRRGVQLNRKDRFAFGLNKHCTVPLDPDKPSHTLTTLPDDILHYAEPRILTAREYARLQSFPDWFEFRGKYATGGYLRTIECPRYTQIGNAVSPLVAECIGNLLKNIASQPAINAAVSAA